MRLINAKTLELKRFDDDTKIPRYAILSHTWGNKEVSLQQFQDACTGDSPTNVAVRKTSGYAKIVQTCHLALEDGCSYAWVDTCCIDKTSSAELSEAINSMFSWYKKADTCYAFLEDVTVHSQPVDYADLVVTETPSFYEEEFRSARWFTRGWTLQELIAPRSVRFYATDWTFIGTRSALTEQLLSITGIDARVLKGGDPDLCSVANRMSWAAKRKTTRTEDIAYCLMGLFDVNMPLLYGEGKKAFVRLQEAILKISEDQSLFAWSPSSKNRTTVDEWGESRASTVGISVFAQHPREFSQASDIVGLTSLGEPTTVTNKGVRVELPIMHWKNPPEDLVGRATSSIFLAVLYCGYAHSKLQLPAIVLRRLPIEGLSHTYVRHESAAVFSIMYDEVEANDARAVYLRSHSSKVSRDFLEHSRTLLWVTGAHRFKYDSKERPKFVEARVFNREWPCSDGHEDFNPKPKRLDKSKSSPVVLVTATAS